jgi:hypothetical protein
MPRRRLDVPKAKQDICTALGAHNTVRAACGYAGIAEPTFFRWMNIDRDFREAVQKAESSSDVRLISLIVKEAQGGTWQAAAWLMERHPRTKRDWRRSEEFDARKLSTEQLLELARAGDRGVESPGDRLALTQAREPPEGE